MKRITINMKLNNTLPFRPYRSNFLSSKGGVKVFVFFLLGFLTVLMGSCSRLNNVESIKVEIWHSGSPLTCNAFESHQQVWSIQQLAFFISDVKLFDENTVYEPPLSSTPWQTDNVVLLQPDLNDCATKSKDENNTKQQDPAARDTNFCD